MCSSGPTVSPSNPRLLTALRHQLRLGHYSQRTEQAYVGWVRRFVRFHGLRHPRELGEEEVVQFLTVLVERHRVAVSTQGQALAALLFLYREVLGRPLRLEGRIPRGRGVTRIPVVLDRGEVGRVLAQLSGVYHLVEGERDGGSVGALTRRVMNRVPHGNHITRRMFRS